MNEQTVAVIVVIAVVAIVVTFIKKEGDRIKAIHAADVIVRVRARVAIAKAHTEAIGINERRSGVMVKAEAYKASQDEARASIARRNKVVANRAYRVSVVEDMIAAIATTTYDWHREDGYEKEITVRNVHSMRGKYSKGGMYWDEVISPREQAVKEACHFAYYGSVEFKRIYGERWEARATRRNVVIKAARIARTNKFMAERKPYIVSRTRYIFSQYQNNIK